VKDWPEVLAGDAVMATAFLDRLLSLTRDQPNGDSCRLGDLERLVK
jgi:hypothetical protein